MDEERRRYWQAYVDELRQLMELRDWEVRLEREPTNRDEAFANVECLYGRKLAALKLSEDWEEHPPEAQRWAIAHELIHCHLTHAADLVNDGLLANELGDTSYHLFKRAFLRAFEYGVDGIAKAWADSLPLPPGDHSMTEDEVERLFDLEPGEVKLEPHYAGRPISVAGVPDLAHMDPRHPDNLQPMVITDPALPTAMAPGGVHTAHFCTACDEELPLEVPFHVVSTCPGFHDGKPLGPKAEAALRASPANQG